MYCALLVAACVTFWLPGDFDTARRDYQDTVRPLLTEGALTAAAVEPVAAVIDRLVATGDAEVFQLLTTDAKQLGARVMETAVELGKKKVALSQGNAALGELQGDERTRAETKLKELTQEVERLETLRGGVIALRDVLYQGLLGIADQAIVASPEAAFEVLSQYLREDSQAYFDQEHKVADLDARRKGVELQLAGATEKVARAELEKQLGDLGAALEVRRSSLERLKQLKERRVAALGKAYPALPKNKQESVWSDIRGNLKDSADWETRTLYLELAAYLPIEAGPSEILNVLKRAAKAKRDLEKELEPLREKYARALKTLQDAARGGGGTVPSVLVASEQSAREELQTASRRSFGELWVTSAAGRALGAAVAVLAGAAGGDKAIQAVLKAAEKESDAVVKLRAIEALGSVPGDAASQALRGLAATGSDVEQRLAALNGLVERKDPQLVELCVGTLLKDKEWQIRAAAMSALVRVPHKEAVPALIASLGVEVGRLVDDAEAALAAITGRSFNGDVTLWKDWWGKHKDTFEIGGGAVARDGAAGPVAPGQARGSVSFYGIQTRSRRILFVLDRSGSMNEPASDATTGKESGQRKIDVARSQLNVAIAGLEDGAEFNIITYAMDVTRWQKRMQKMTDALRKKATKYVDSDIEAVGGTNIYDALQEGFRIAGIGAQDKAYESNVDTIFFLSDGEPTNGEVTDPQEILKRVREWNRISRIVVHSVGVGKGHDAAFMRRLAEENGGQYTTR